LAAERSALTEFHSKLVELKPDGDGRVRMIASGVPGAGSMRLDAGSHTGFSLLTEESSASMPQPNGTISRKGAKAAKKKACHFDQREKSFLRSLAFCSGMTGPSLCVLGVLARVNSRSIREKFAQGAESKEAHFRFWNW
jgi:hypothetical protein